MPYYITYGEFQKQMTDYYRQTGKRMQFTEMTDYLYRKGLLKQTIEMPNLNGLFENMSDKDFEKITDSFVHILTPQVPATSSVVETDIIPPKRDVFIIRHPQFTRPNPHTHNFFEINYVVRGSCRFTFEDETSTLQEGELCIIAPSSRHDILIDDDGPGIPEDKREDVFRPFYRLDESRNMDTGGVGLGLSIAKDIITSHGGKIELLDSPIGGLRVLVSIPL